MDAYTLQKAWAELDKANQLYNAVAFRRLGSVAVDYATAGPLLAQGADPSTLLDTIGAKLAELAPDGRLGLALQDGSLEPARWFAILQVQVDALNDYAKQWGLSPVSLERFWTEVVVQTGSDVKTGAQAVAAEVKSDALPIYLAVVVLLVLILLVKVT